LWQKIGFIKFVELDKNKTFGIKDKQGVTTITGSAISNKMKNENFALRKTSFIIKSLSPAA
jgi:hypothetical protein